MYTYLPCIGLAQAESETTIQTTTRSCADLFSPAPARTTLRWEDSAETSVVDGTVFFAQVNSTLQIVREGEVTAGRFEGNWMRRTVTYSGVDALTECMSEQGLQNLNNGILELLITPV
ncbi:hypothetical protein V1J52_22025 [Streptomyces sp. TRM 70351]|uniref:hypothetical protein n=1 Tax=Streptomyces sp. TRM 70351 TaxID=3116552 RepID=UPI002E7AEC86|nr:hypothetical protein [Streptomyces sp. TRM 70351]MEE1930828.1 hypothetical protein [Streptomyces sp. TRM 70351]